MLDVKQLRVLRAVAEHGSFSAAADSLSYTQPAISQQIAALEKRAGTTLVDRGSRGVRLTDAGRALVEHAEVVIARLAAAEAELEAIAGIRGGRVRLSSFPSAGASLLPPAIALFTERHPEVELSFVEQEPEEAVPMLRAAELEVALVFEYRDMSQPEFDRLYEGIELRHLIDDPMYLAIPRDHPAARRPRIRLHDVAEDTWIQNDTTGPCGRLHLAACAAAGFEPRIGFQSDDYNVVQGLIAAGVGVSLLPALSLTNVREDIVVRSLGKSAPTRRIAAATLAGRYRSPAANAMLDILSEAADRFELPAGAAIAA
ncbi:MAG TPA: LysR family transcriptional regulator [Thermoleophilaceae bacterium]|jgi:DNA-binding transcriptional LysR family regulator|nr:LysR family transcriptional regulator [Thermoleophilaceae bacterium]